MRPRNSDLAAAALFLALSVVMTWPLARHLSRAVSDWGDPLLNAWILDWDVYAATHAGTRLFDAPVFYPHHDTLALSEHLCGLAVFAAPMRWLGAGPITAANILWILGFAFTGFGTYVAARMLTGSRGAGIVAGVFAAFVPWRFLHITHLQIASGGWLPLMIAALYFFAASPTWRRAALFGAIYFMNGWTNLHYFAFGSVVIAMTTPIMLRRDARAYFRIAVATIGALVLMLPFLLPYRAAMKEYHMREDISETRLYSARPADWLYVTSWNRFYGPLQDQNGPDEPERLLFPGYLGVMLAMGGVVCGRGTGRAAGVLWTLAGFLGSLGLNGWFHTALFNAIPVFHGIRVPARWAVIAYFGIALLAAFGAKALAGRIPFAHAVLTVMLLLELRAAPLPLQLGPSKAPPVYAWLRGAAIHGGIEHLPAGEAKSEFLYMFRETEHHKPQINGGGIELPLTSAIAKLAEARPIPDALMDQLERANCSLVLVHSRTMSGGRDFLRRQLQSGRLAFVARFPDGVFGDYVFAVRRVEPHMPAGDPSVAQRFVEGLADVNTSTIESLIRADQMDGMRSRPAWSVADRHFIVPIAASFQGVPPSNYTTEARLRGAGASVTLTLWPQGLVRRLRLADDGASFTDVLYDNFGILGSGWMDIASDRAIEVSFALVDRGTNGVTPIAALRGMPPREVQVRDAQTLWLLNSTASPVEANVCGTLVTLPPHTLLQRSALHACRVSGVYAFGSTKRADGVTEFEWP